VPLLPGWKAMPPHCPGAGVALAVVSEIGALAVPFICKAPAT
jgi:hypothetical protein